MGKCFESPTRTQFKNVCVAFLTPQSHECQYANSNFAKALENHQTLECFALVHWENEKLRLGFWVKCDEALFVCHLFFVIGSTLNGQFFDNSFSFKCILDDKSSAIWCNTDGSPCINHVPMIAAKSTVIKSNVIVSTFIKLHLRKLQLSSREQWSSAFSSVGEKRCFIAVMHKIWGAWPWS